MSHLPQGWAETTLDNLAEINPGRLGDVAADTHISFVPMPAVSDTEGEIVSPSVRPFAEVSKGYTQFRDGDVIFAKITPCMENGKIAVARGLENGMACGSTEFHVVRPSAGISPDFIWRYLRQKSFRNDAEASMTGAVGQRRVPASFLKEQTFALPPLPEQRRSWRRSTASPKNPNAPATTSTTSPVSSRNTNKPSSPSPSGAS